MLHSECHQRKKVIDEIKINNLQNKKQEKNASG